MCNEGVPLCVMAKGTNWFLDFCFHAFVAECITIDAYTGIALYGFLIATNSSNCLS